MSAEEIYNLYTTHYNIHRSQYIYVPITEEEFSTIAEYAQKAAQLRYGQPGYTGTSIEQLQASFTMGGAAEAAVLKHLRYSIQDMETSVYGDARDFAHPDLSCIGIDCGVKVSRFGYPPLIVSSELFPFESRCGCEVICTISGRNILTDENGSITMIKGVWINGFATPAVLMKFQDRSLVYHQDNQKYANRCGFYGFDYLFPLNSKVNIQYFLKHNSKKYSSKKIFS